jgi:hypothetical protein
MKELIKNSFSIIQYVGLANAHVRGISEILGKRNELHNFFILDALANKNTAPYYSLKG